MLATPNFTPNILSPWLIDSVIITLSLIKTIIRINGCCNAEKCQSVIYGPYFKAWKVIHIK